jgi:hypothetical protein
VITVVLLPDGLWHDVDPGSFRFTHDGPGGRFEFTEAGDIVRGPYASVLATREPAQ